MYQTLKNHVNYTIFTIYSTICYILLLSMLLRLFMLLQLKDGNPNNGSFCPSLLYSAFCEDRLAA